jgi:hypothetical protein
MTVQGCSESSFHVLPRDGVLVPDSLARLKEWAIKTRRSGFFSIRFRSISPKILYEL